MKENLLPLILVKRFAIDPSTYARGLSFITNINVEQTGIVFLLYVPKANRLLI